MGWRPDERVHLMTSDQRSLKALRYAALLTAATTATATLGVVTAPAAHAAQVDVATIADLQAAASCTGTAAAPDTYTLTTDIDAPSAEVVIGCHAVLDLAGNDLAVRNIVINAGQALTINDTGTGGTLTADATGNFLLTSIRNTDATLTITAGTVTATGGGRAAGIGGGDNGDGGTTTITGG